MLQQLMVSVNHKFLGPKIMLLSFQGLNQCIQLSVLSRIFQAVPFSFSLKYAMGRPSCIGTVPIPKTEALHSKSKVFAKLGKASKGE